MMLQMWPASCASNYCPSNQLVFIMPGLAKLAVMVDFGIEQVHQRLLADAIKLKQLSYTQVPACVLQCPFVCFLCLVCAVRHKVI
jgi:hypothetical protein